MEVSDLHHVPDASPPGKAPGTQRIRSWVGSITGLDAVTKRAEFIPFPFWEFNPGRPYLARYLY